LLDPAFLAPSGVPTYVAVRHRAVNRRRICGALVAIWIAFFAVQAEAIAAEPTLLLMGDSLTAGYGLPHEQGFAPRLQAALEKSGQKVTLVEAGVSGDTSAGGRARLAWALGGAPGGKVDAAILELGANDALRGLSPGQMKTNLAAMLDEFKRRGIPVLLAGMHAPPNLGETYGREYDAVFDGLSKSYDVVYYPFFLDGVAMKPELNQADGIHPNPTGVDIIVSRILPSVQQLLKRVAASSVGR
jgi:acyl-CoA thioesterase I